MDRVLYEDSDLLVKDVGDKMYTEGVEESSYKIKINGLDKEVYLRGVNEFSWEDLLKENSYIYDNFGGESFLFLNSPDNSYDINIKLNNEQIKNIKKVNLNKKEVEDDRIEVEDNNLIIKSIGINLPNTIDLIFTDSLPDIRLEDVFFREVDEQVDISTLEIKKFNLDIPDSFEGKIAINGNVFMVTRSIINEDVSLNEYAEFFISSDYLSINNEIQMYNDKEYYITLIPDNHPPIRKSVSSNVKFCEGDFKEFSEIHVNLMGKEELSSDFDIIYNDSSNLGLSEEYISGKYCHKEIVDDKVIFSNLIPNTEILLVFENDDYSEQGRLIKGLDEGCVKHIDFEVTDERR